MEKRERKKLLPPKIEIIGVKYKENDYGRLLAAFDEIYKYYKPVLLIMTENYTEGLGDQRARYWRQHYLCRRKNLLAVLFNKVKWIINRKIFPINETY